MKTRASVPELALVLTLSLLLGTVAFALAAGGTVDVKHFEQEVGVLLSTTGQGKTSLLEGQPAAGQITIPRRLALMGLKSANKGDQVKITLIDRRAGAFLLMHVPSGAELRFNYGKIEDI